MRTSLRPSSPSGTERSALSVSVTGRTGIRALHESMRATIDLMREAETSGRTPSWMATTAPSGTFSSAARTE